MSSEFRPICDRWREHAAWAVRRHGRLLATHIVTNEDGWVARVCGKHAYDQLEHIIRRERIK